MDIMSSRQVDYQSNCLAFRAAAEPVGLQRALTCLSRAAPQVQAVQWAELQAQRLGPPPAAARERQTQASAQATAGGAAVTAAAVAVIPAWGERTWGAISLIWETLAIWAVIWGKMVEVCGTHCLLYGKAYRIAIERRHMGRHVTLEVAEMLGFVNFRSTNQRPMPTFAVQASSGTCPHP
jgi:hypothetical protein